MRSRGIEWPIKKADLMKSDSFKMAASSSTDVDDELSDEISSKSSLLNRTFVIDEDDDKRGSLTFKKTSVNQVKSRDELVNITDGAFETILKEASTPLYSKSSKNVLLQKVINETNFDEPFSASTGKFPPCYRENRRHLERRLRQDYESTAASTTTQGGSLQNLHRKPEGKKLLRKSGSLNAFPAGSDDTPELAALKSYLAASATCEPPPKERFPLSVTHLSNHESSNDREEEQRCGGGGGGISSIVGHRRNRSMSECLGVVRDLAETDEESVTPIAVENDDKESKSYVVESESNDATILNCVKRTSESDDTEVVEMMDVDHSSEEAKSCETSPLLKTDSFNGVRWSSVASRQVSSVEQRGFAEVTTTRCYARVSEADDKVDFPLMTQSHNEQNGQLQSLTEIGFGGLKGSRKNTVLTNHHQTVARLVGGSEGENHVVASESHIYDRKKPESDLKICGLQRPLDENGNPLIYQEGGGLGTYRSTNSCYPSQFTHHQHHRDVELNLGLETNPRLRKQKKARQNSKQKVMKAEQIDGHFGALDIEMIMKRINSEDEENNVVSNDSRTKRISQKETNKHLVNKTKKPFSGNKDNNRKNLENRMDSDPTPNGHRSEHNSLPVDGDDAGTHQERSNVRSKPSKVRKQEFQKRNGGGSGGGSVGGGMNGSSDGGSSNKTSFEGDSSSNPTRSPERIAVSSSIVDTKIEKATSEDSNAVVVEKISSFVADFYAVTEIPGSVDEREFHEVRKKKKKKRLQQSCSLQVTKGDGGRYSHRVRDQGGGCVGGASFGNQSQSSGGGRGVGDGGVLWPDLSSLSRRHADDVRRKSAGSVPPSEHSSEDNSDVESVHSLPVCSTSPKTSVSKTSSSSSCTPQASYADIARMSAVPTINPRGNFSLSASSMSSLGHSDNTKRDAFTSTSADKYLLSPRSGTTDEIPSNSEPSLSDTGEECATVIIDDRILPSLIVMTGSSSAATGSLPVGVTDVSFGCGIDVTVACERSATEELSRDTKVSRTLDLGGVTVVENFSDSIVGVKDTSLGKLQSAIDDVVVVSLPSTTSKITKEKVTNPSKSNVTLCNSKSRPVVIFAGDLGSPVELNEVTFGFEVNEQLLRDSAVEQTALAPFPTVDVGMVPVSFGTVMTMPSIVDRRRQHHRPLTTCSDDDDSIIASGSITSFHSHDCSPISERTFNLGSVRIGNVVHEAPTSSEVHNFNYDNVVDYIGLAWNGVQKELEKEAGRSNGGAGGSSGSGSQMKIQYYKRAD